MTGRSGPAPSQGADTVYFLSDYGRRDELVGVVHAVLRRLAPHAAVIDLTHDIPPFDVRAGAEALARAVLHLGPGVVLAVVDPGVGGPRHGVVVEVAAAGPGPRWFVGPDNGLLVPGAAAAAGPVARVVAIDRPGSAVPAPEPAPGRLPGRPPEGSPGRSPEAAPGTSATFDGRDLFAPAVAALCNGVAASDLGVPLDPSGLVRLAEPVVEHGALADGRRMVRAEAVWVDRFGNVQLAASGDMVPAAVERLTVGTAAHRGAPSPEVPVVPRAPALPDGDAGGPEVPVVPGAPVLPDGDARVGGTERVRRVRTYADLAPGEPGVLVDANGRVALVVREGSAARHFGVPVGAVVELVW